ncbi:unnamed protein product, partial [Brachionus calyciflorus]
DKKADRCSLAAQIILSNIQKQNEQQKIKTYERIKRPISPIRIQSNTFYRPANIKPPITRTKLGYIDDEKSDKLSTQQTIPSLIKQNQKIILQDYQQPFIRPYNLKNDSNSPIIDPNLKSPKSTIQLQDFEGFSILKELIMTERTYKKDLDLVTILFRQFAIKQNCDLNEYPLFEQILYSDQCLLPLHDFHTKFLNELEIRLYKWTDNKNSDYMPSSFVMGDLLSQVESVICYYRFYIQKYEFILNELEQLCKKNKKFETLYKEFELLKVCYLPFTMFLFKPIQRIVHYKTLIERLLVSYGIKHPEYQQLYVLFEKLDSLNDIISDKISLFENKQKILELEKDLVNYTSDKELKRQFIREGSLQKFSRKGYQQRMFFLFDNALLYCAKSSTSSGLQFKIHGEYELKNIQVEDGNAHLSVENSFTIHSLKRSLLLCAVSSQEKNKWLQDLYEAIEKAKSQNENNNSPLINSDCKSNLSTLKSNSSSDNNLDLTHELDDQHQNANVQHRANTTMHVCWHRNTSVSAMDIHKSNVNQLSGYLLRKFKNSNGWQKLWVVFTNFCLFFYKTYQDEYPLASLPLLGYTVTIPNESDNINKEFVFKLQFKNHVYFFRAESQYSFDRWLKVIESAAQNSSMSNMID